MCPNAPRETKSAQGIVAMVGGSVFHGSARGGHNILLQFRREC